MPKKRPRNSYFFFLLNFKEEQAKKGIKFDNMAQVDAAAGPVWKELPPAARKPFEEKAQKDKQKYNIRNEKYNNQGVPLSVIKQQEKVLQEAQLAEVDDIKKIVRTYHVNGTLTCTDFYLIDVNSYCETKTHCVIAEFSVLRFNLKDGIKDNYHENINPGSIPTGYAYDVIKNCKEFGLEMPDDSVPSSNYISILAKIIDYLKQNVNSNVLPPMFTMPNRVSPVQDFISQLCNSAHEDETQFRIYRLDTLFYNIVNTIKSQDNEGLPKESLALAELVKDSFKYNLGLGCEQHEKCDKSLHCTQSRVKRWVFTIMDSTCPIAGIKLIPGQHLPFDCDLDSIKVFEEQKEGRLKKPASDTGFSASSPRNPPTDSFNDSSIGNDGDFTVVQRKKKVNRQPMRLPKPGYFQNIRLAPDISESKITPISAGRGAGRGKVSSLSSLSNLKLKD